MKNENPLPSIDIKHEFTVCIDAFEVFADRVSFEISLKLWSQTYMFGLKQVVYITCISRREYELQHPRTITIQFHVSLAFDGMRERADAEVKTE